MHPMQSTSESSFCRHNAGVNLGRFRGKGLVNLCMSHWLMTLTFFSANS